MYNFKVKYDTEAMSLGTEFGKAYKELKVLPEQNPTDTLLRMVRNERGIDTFEINKTFATIVALGGNGIESTGLVQNTIFAEHTGHYARMRGVDVQLELDRYAQAKEERAYNHKYAQEFTEMLVTSFSTYDGDRAFDL